MGFDQRFYDKAQQETDLIQTKNARLTESRIRETDLKYPEIAEIRKKIALTSTRLLGVIADRGKDIKASLDSLEAENLTLQKSLEDSLVKRGLPANYLDPVYDCAECKDTGISGGKRCYCFMERVKKAATDELNSTSPLKLCGFDEFDLTYYDDSTPLPHGYTSRQLMEKNLEFCKNYAENFCLPYVGLMLRGATGLGKTHLSLSIASEVIKKGYSVIYCSAPDIFRRIEKEHFSSGEDGTDTLDMIISADLLVLDDLGAEFENKFSNSILYNIINDRMNALRPTIISTNLELKEIEQRYGERICSRMTTMTKLLFSGEDIRLLKKKRRLK